MQQHPQDKSISCFRREWTKDIISMPGNDAAGENQPVDHQIDNGALGLIFGGNKEEVST